MKIKRKSITDKRTGAEWSRTIARNVVIKNNPLKKRSVVKLKKTITNYQDNPDGGRIAKTVQRSGYKKVYKNGVLKKQTSY